MPTTVWLAPKSTTTAWGGGQDCGEHGLAGGDNLGQALTIRRLRVVFRRGDEAIYECVDILALAERDGAGVVQTGEWFERRVRVEQGLFAQAADLADLRLDEPACVLGLVRDLEHGRDGPVLRQYQGEAFGLDLRHGRRQLFSQAQGSLRIAVVHLDRLAEQNAQAPPMRLDSQELVRAGAWIDHDDATTRHREDSVQDGYREPGH